MTNENNTTNHQIRLYSLLVDQIQKYNTIFWQFPTAIAAVNFLALHNFSLNPYLLFALFLLNSALIYAFTRMVCTQQTIIQVTKKAEQDLLGKNFSSFVPKFDPKPFKAPNVVVCVLWILNFALFIWFIFLVCGCSKAS